VSFFGGPAWSFDEQRGQWYLHQFLPQQPDLNIRNEAVQKEIENTMRFWLQEKKVDGFRIDALGFLFEEENFRDEPLITKDKIENLNYPDLDHIYTFSIPETFEILVEWRKLIEQIAREENSE
ncbi:maltase 1-like, partial [Brachionus plicatilis]